MECFKVQPIKCLGENKFNFLLFLINEILIRKKLELQKEVQKKEKEQKCSLCG